MQSKEELENWYRNSDPWGYTTNKDDEFRKNVILNILSPHKYMAALDIGCGEGFLTKDLPAELIHGYDVSETAMSRLPLNVVADPMPFGNFDLVISTGTLYKQYDHEAIAKMIFRNAIKHILIAGIKDWLIDYYFGEVVKTTEFQYREYVQKVTLYTLV